jgi:hypothetical protein
MNAIIAHSDSPRQPRRTARAVFALALAGALLTTALGLAGCGVTGPAHLRGTGTVRFQSIEGGFYGIVADDGSRLDPRNLPAAFQHDGERVRYHAIVVEEGASVHMWGTIVTLVTVDAAS